MKTIFILIGLTILLALLFVRGQYLAWFCRRPCKYCGHTLEYKGLKEDSDKGHYLFHCPKCGSWEQIPCEKFIEEHSMVFNNKVEP